MRILWHSTPSGVRTGYGNQTGLFTSRLKQLGLEVFISPVHGLNHTHVNEDGITVLAKSRRIDDYGNDLLQSHVNYCEPDIVFSWCDPFVLNYNIWEQLPWVCYTILDSYPLNPAVHEAIAHAKFLMAPSKFAKKALEEAGYPSTYCPHAIDTKKYNPIPYPDAREELNKIAGKDLSDKFFVSTVGANVGAYRKNYERMFQIWGMFIREHPDAVLYVHSEITGMWGGQRLVKLQKFFGIPDENIIFAPQYEYVTGLFDETFLRVIYSASDCYLQTTKGEGFGIPVIEAQACGCPVIATHCSTMPELVGSGETVPGRIVVTNYESFWVDIKVQECLDALGRMYDNRGNLELRKKATEFGEKFGIDLVLQKYWLPTFDKAFKVVSI